MSKQSAIIPHVHYLSNAFLLICITTSLMVSPIPIANDIIILVRGYMVATGCMSTFSLGHWWCIGVMWLMYYILSYHSSVICFVKNVYREDNIVTSYTKCQ